MSTNGYCQRTDTARRGPVSLGWRSDGGSRARDPRAGRVWSGRASAPASSAPCSIARYPKPVRIDHRDARVRGSALSWRVAVIPSMPGIARSITITSGRSAPGHDQGRAASGADTTPVRGMSGTRSRDPGCAASRRRSTPARCRDAGAAAEPRPCARGEPGRGQDERRPGEASAGAAARRSAARSRSLAGRSGQ